MDELQYLPLIFDVLIQISFNYIGKNSILKTEIETLFSIVDFNNLKIP